jgi:hypothetical protein
MVLENLRQIGKNLFKLPKKFLNVSPTILGLGFRGHKSSMSPTILGLGFRV